MDLTKRLASWKVVQKLLPLHQPQSLRLQIKPKLLLVMTSSSLPQ